MTHICLLDLEAESQCLSVPDDDCAFYYGTPSTARFVAQRDLARHITANSIDQDYRRNRHTDQDPTQQT